LVSVLGAGLLVGTALAVIIPEGVRSLNTVVTVHSKNIFIINWIYFNCLVTWSKLVWNKFFFSVVLQMDVLQPQLQWQILLQITASAIL